MSSTIEIVPYDPRWPDIYEKEAAVIREAVGDNFLEIHHVGSTAVPGLASKPKIDIALVVRDSRSGRCSLEKIGFHYRGEYNIPLRCFFSKKGKTDLNLHLYEERHPEIESMLCFRDHLRHHPQKRDEYAQLKADLIKDESSFDKENSPFANYTLRKGDFIRGVLRESGFKRMRLLKCNDETEWKAAHYFRKTYFFDSYGKEDSYTWTLNHAEHSHLALYQGADIIGYAHVYFFSPQKATIPIFIISEKEKNQRTDKEFLALIEVWLKALGVEIMKSKIDVV